jgi:hypothetical protein
MKNWRGGKKNGHSLKCREPAAGMFIYMFSMYSRLIKALTWTF